MSLDQELRTVLRQESEHHEPPLPDIGALWTAGRARRRRQRVVRGALGAVVAVVASSALAFGVSQRLSGGDVAPAEQPSPFPTVELPAGAPPTIPYCSKATSGSPEILHVEGRDLPIDCVYRNFPEPGHHTYLWHHAGRTIIGSLDGVSVVTRDGAVRISQIPHPDIRISDDGRYVAWDVAEGGPAPSRGLTLYDLVEGHEVETASTPFEAIATFQTVEAIDALGRVFLINADDELWMYDIADDTWTEVSGLPEDSVRSGGYGGYLSYQTDDGFAVLVRKASPSDPVGHSVEGEVTADGRFVPLREVPIGVASWSPDRSRFLQLTYEGYWVQFWVQPADDFDAKVVLALPEDVARNVFIWDAQWESASAVLLTLWRTGPDDTGGPDVVRCFVDSGDCERLTGIVVPLSVQAHPLG